LTPAYWRFLCSFAGTGRSVVVRRAHGRLEPLAALYHRAARGEVAALLDAGVRSMHELLSAVEIVEVSEDAVVAACGGAVFRNVNRPDDLERHRADPCGS